MAAEEFRALLDRVAAGDEEAARRLVQEYGGLLRQAIRKRLPSRLRLRLDSLDVSQDVWASFFAELPRPCRFNTPDDLAGFLVRLARNKVADAVRENLQVQKNTLNRESREGSDFLEGQACPHQSTPSIVAMSREEWQRLLDRQPPVYRRLLVLIREGKSPQEAAREIGVSERTAVRLVNRVLPGLTP